MRSPTRCGTGPGTSVRSSGTTAPVSNGRPSYHITRYDDVEHVLRDWETFSSSINAEVIGEYMGELILAMNGTEHRQYRNLVAKAFRASVLERWDHELVAPLIGELLDRIAPLDVPTS